jgi:hypothetical protein
VFPEQELLRLLDVLTEDGQKICLFGITRVVDDLGRLLERDLKSRDSVSAYLASVIGDLSVIVEGFRQLYLYQPWAQCLEMLELRYKTELEQAWEQRGAYWPMLVSIMDGPEQQDIATLGIPDHGRFYYPAEKRRTEENVDAMRLAEGKLDKFRKAFDECLRKKMGSKLAHSAVGKLL